MNARWALKKTFFSLSHKDYIREVLTFLDAFTEAFGRMPEVEIKVYDRPMSRPTVLHRGWEPIDTPQHRLADINHLTAAMWQEAVVCECVVKLSDAAEYCAVFGSIQGGRRYPRQMTFYLQGTNADERVGAVCACSCALTPLSVDKGKKAWRSFHN